MLNPFKLMAIYGDLNRFEGVAKEAVTMQVKVAQYLTLLISLFGTIGVPALATNWLHAHLVAYTVCVAVAILLHAVFPSIFSAPSAADTKAAGLTSASVTDITSSGTAKLSVLLLCSVLLMGSMAGCSGSQVAQDIVNWTPTIISTANVVGSTVAALAPADAAVISVGVAGFDVMAQTVSNQASAYLANPNATLLQALQSQVTTFQQSVNSAVLQAVKITDPASQQKVIASIQALSVGVNAVLALIASISGNTVSASQAAVKVAQVEPLMDRRMTVAMVAAHYGESDARASAQVEWAQAKLAAVGF